MSIHEIKLSLSTVKTSSRHIIFNHFHRFGVVFVTCFWDLCWGGVGLVYEMHTFPLPHSCIKLSIPKMKLSLFILNHFVQSWGKAYIHRTLEPLKHFLTIQSHHTPQINVWYIIYLHLVDFDVFVTYIYHQNHLNVGKYTLHSSQWYRWFTFPCSCRIVVVIVATSAWAADHPRCHHRIQREGRKMHGGFTGGPGRWRGMNSGRV